MPAAHPTSFLLQFDPKLSLTEDGKHVRDGLSTALRTGDNLWLACDEHATVERLRLTGPHTFSQHCTFRLADLIDMPDPDAEAEVDIEGMAEGGGYLWLVGSHGLKRKDPKPEKDGREKSIAKLAKVSTDPNRYLLARIPLVRNPETEDYELHPTASHPNKKGHKLRAARLGSHTLLRLLARDPHIGPFLKLPGKDNGFDIEGLAVTNDGRLYVGLRGPVLRGWAIVLELQPVTGRRGRLKLAEIPGAQYTYYRKHFLDLGGMGLRELRCVNNDLYLLAGPTMDLDGTIAVYRWPDGLHQKHDSITPLNKIERLFDVPHGHGRTAGRDKAEGMALLNENHVLILFDSPTDERKQGKNDVLADGYRLVAETWDDEEADTNAKGTKTTATTRKPAGKLTAADRAMDAAPAGPATATSEAKSGQ
ncbi:DUF3616 domain-containing protein [Hymenobacter koreensis]|uniref:DUF3616 domain-containing protein n=1 Tax=Hymenobacter koreensis TaxID=1084523 RepID=A0ABP8JLI4_9BACT